MGFKFVWLERPGYTLLDVEKEPDMKLNEAFPSTYLKSDDLQGKDASVVIATAEMETVGDERKLVLTFQGKKKSMICNKTNASRIAFLYGDETDDWVGKEIILTSEFVEFQGKTVKGLRVRPPKQTVVDDVEDTF